MKRPLYLKNGVFLIYATNKITVVYLCSLQKTFQILQIACLTNTKGYFTLIFTQDEVKTTANNPQRIWVVILDRHLSRSIVIQKHRSTGFFVIKPSNNIDIEHEATTSAKNKATNSKKMSETQNLIRRFFKQVWLRLCWWRRCKTVRQNCTQDHKKRQLRG